MKALVVILLIIIGYMSVRIIDLENYRYASFIGSCGDIKFPKQSKCLEEQETRTNPIWHLVYGLKLF